MFSALCASLSVSPCGSGVSCCFTAYVSDAPRQRQACAMARLQAGWTCSCPTGGAPWQAVGFAVVASCQEICHYCKIFVNSLLSDTCGIYYMGGVNANTDAKSIHFALASRRKRCSMSSRRFTGRVCRFQGKSRKNFVLSSFAECFFRELLKIDKTL